MTSIIRTERLTKAYGPHRGIVDVDLEVEAERDLRVPRAQRCRQDHDDPDPARPDPADVRARVRVRHRDDRRPGGRSTVASATSRASSRSTTA